MKFVTKINENGFEMAQCPVCYEWQFRIRPHLALKKDYKHKKFYKKHSKLKVIRTIAI